MKQILFVIAMQKESTDIAKKLGLEKINENEYRKNNISLIITGIGKQQTAINLTKYLENCENKPDLIINMGYVGSTNSQIGEWVNVNRSYNYEWNIPGEQQYTVENFNANVIKALNSTKIEQLNSQISVSKERISNNTTNIERLTKEIDELHQRIFKKLRVPEIKLLTL